MEDFFIVCHNGDKSDVFHKKVQGDRVKIRDRDCFVFIDPEETEQGIVEGYNVSDLETGFCLTINLSKSKAIEIANELLKEYPHAVKYKLEQLKQMGVKVPVNT